ncbi:YopX family protein [Aerococcaceae bacterium NML130460]|nr:YopX family protein [Aerococcaceae bacterium NML130460]
MITKYRAYSDQYGMREVVGLWWHKDHLQVSLANGVSTPIRTKDSQVKLMQSTGLADKNGVEIFEGDIVRIDGGKLNDTLEDLGEEIGVIRFTEGAFYIDYHGLDTDFELLSSVELPTEVTGNIYENRELLEGNHG